MADCPFTNQVHAYHDGELDQVAQEQVKQHLLACPSCRAELSQLASLSRLLEENLTVEIPPVVRRALHERADRQPTLGLQHWAEASAAVAATILLVCSLWMSHLPSRGGQATLPVWDSQAMVVSDNSPDGSEEMLKWMAQDMAQEE
jgi:predicted anti-sigma-YlaC factor YlaD